MAAAVHKPVCLLTGAGGRLGSALCQLYAGRWEIVGAYRKRPPPALPGVHAVQADLALAGAAEELVDAALAVHGRVDLLVNNAVHSVWAPALEDRLLASMQRQFELNAMLPLRLTSLLARKAWQAHPEENRARNRSVVNVSSIAALHVYPGGQSVYAASKAALNMLTRQLAAELAPLSVRVNATAPNGFPRIVATEAVAATVLKLAEGDMTGKILVLDRAGEAWA